ncbi:porin [Aquabacterium sp.]|uniref:porin n=1 Tax=Aquabacterium sp. TaxID=1872578 RepID=UPI003D6D3E1F
MFAKKNLVAAAALMALVGAAQADVKVYGSVEASFGSFETAHAKNLTTSSRVTAVESGNMMTSFIGFSGSEDLGNGLKAEFALETFVGVDKGSNITNNAGQFWSRTSNVALSGGFGKVALGQYDNPLFTSGYTYNPFGSSMPFSPTMRHLNYIGQTTATGVPAIAGAGVGFDTGWINSITYESPNLSGFSFVGQAALKESNAANTKNSYTAAATYAAGPFGATLTYVKSGFTPAGPNPLQTYNGDEKTIDLGVSYDFGAVKLFGQYTDIKEDANPSAALGGTADNKDRIYQVGVSIPVTEKGSILASYGELKHEIKSGASAGLEAKDRVFSLGYDHFLSKRTDVYAVFSNNGQTNLESGQTFAVGIKHAF